MEKEQVAVQEVKPQAIKRSTTATKTTTKRSAKGSGNFNGLALAGVLAAAAGGLFFALRNRLGDGGRADSEEANAAQAEVLRVKKDLQREIDEGRRQAELQRQREEEEKRRRAAAERERLRAEEEERKRLEREKKAAERKADEERKRVERERQAAERKADEERKRVERERQAAERKAEEERKRLERERLRKAEEEKKRVEREKKAAEKKAEEERKRLERQRQKEEEEAKRAERDKLRKAEEERKKREKEQKKAASAKPPVAPAFGKPPPGVTKVAGGRRLAKKASRKPKTKTAGLPTTKSKLKEKVKKRTGGVDPRAPKATIVPISQGGDGRAGGDLVINDEGVDEVFSMGYTYTTTVTDARVQAISGKHKSLLAKKIPDKKK
ncbi:hypothetical protein HKI87_19g88270 [Chloropicon roscoffensis]|uniref:TolA protein n=1 Tax=Chloropicon roscoffensis TaxID=1461544 RepID=A0AAX4PMU1_9CHLO